MAGKKYYYWIIDVRDGCYSGYSFSVKCPNRGHEMDAPSRLNDDVIVAADKAGYFRNEYDHCGCGVQGPFEENDCEIEGWTDDAREIELSEGNPYEIKEVTLSEATDSQIIEYITDNPEEFGVPDNVKLTNDPELYSLTRYCDTVEVKFYKDWFNYEECRVEYTEIFSLKLDPYMRIVTYGRCRYEETPAEGKGLF